jgi:hypothetical protein
MEGGGITHGCSTGTKRVESQHVPALSEAVGNIEFAYVQRIKEPPTLRLALGSAAHTAVEFDLREKMETGDDQPLEQMQDTFRDEFEKESYGAEDTPKETKGQALDSGVKCVEVWHKKVAPDTHPLAVEEEVQFSINGVPIAGTIDVVKQVGDPTSWFESKRIIGDWKFVGKKPQDAGTYLLNMIGYGIGLRQKTGLKEDGIVLDHLVRTKEPYHFPIASKGPIPDESIDAYGDIVAGVARDIEAGSFPPTGLQGHACSWCGYKARCPAYKAAHI